MAMKDIDIWRSAQLMIQNYGDQRRIGGYGIAAGNGADRAAGMNGSNQAGTDIVPSATAKEVRRAIRKSTHRQNNFRPLLPRRPLERASPTCAGKTGVFAGGGALLVGDRRTVERHVRARHRTGRT